MMSRYVRVSRNFVNLGNLYSVPPWGSVMQKNTVNLGDLYMPNKDLRPPGWAYFDDGSVFIVPHGLSHDVFEKRMNVAARFVNSPSPKIQAVRQKEPQRNRLILIAKGVDLKQDILHIQARNAISGQRVTVVNPPFEDVALQLDQSGSYPIFAQFKDAPQLNLKHRMRNSNGLLLSNKPDILKPQLQEKRRKRDYKARALCESVGLPNRAPAKLLHQLGARPPRDSPMPAKQQHFQQQETQTAHKKRPPRQHSHPPISDDPSSVLEQDIERREAEIARRERDMEARERELEQRDEVLWWKRKTWLLEQKLAIATGGRPLTLHNQYQNDGDALQDGPKETPKSSTMQEALSDPNAENTGNAFDAFDFNAPSPPKALAQLRSRIQVSKR